MNTEVVKVFASALGDVADETKQGIITPPVVVNVAVAVIVQRYHPLPAFVIENESAEVTPVTADIVPFAKSKPYPLFDVPAKKSKILLLSFALAYTETEKDVPDDTIA